jgi:hypothetical protein
MPLLLTTESNLIADRFANGVPNYRFEIIIYSTLIHPPANGQVEATNKTLLKTLKKKLGKKKGAWADYVPEVLWAYRTTTRTLTGATPFALTFGSEAVIHVEVRSPSFRVSHYNP